MSLALVSEMAVSKMVILGGAGLQLGGAGLHLGIEVKTAEIIKDCSLSLFLVKLIFGAAPHRQAKSSQPLFLVAPGPSGLLRVAVSMWPGLFFYSNRWFDGA